MMKRLLPSLFVLAVFATPALADPCDTLINMTRSAMEAPGISADERSQLEGILNAGEAAKASGDLSLCEAAMTSTPGKLPSSMPPGRDGRSCKKSLNTV